MEGEGAITANSPPTAAQHTMPRHHQSDAHLVQLVRREGVCGTQQAVEVVGPEVVADEREDGNPGLGLKRQARAVWVGGRDG